MVPAVGKATLVAPGYRLKEGGVDITHHRVFLTSFLVLVH